MHVPAMAMAWGIEGRVRLMNTPWMLAGYGVRCFKHWQVDCPTCG